MGPFRFGLAPRVGSWSFQVRLVALIQHVLEFQVWQRMIKTFTKSRIYHGFTQWMLDSRHWFIKIHPFSVISSWWLCLGFGWPNCLVSAAFEPKNARCLYTLRESNMATGNSRTGEALIGKSSVNRRCSIAAFDYQRVCDYIYIHMITYVCIYTQHILLYIYICGI